MNRGLAHVARGLAAIAVVFPALALTSAQLPPSDPEAAERQYRLARRLAAEASPDAFAAFARAVDLAPDGPLADDALVESARLLGLPSWPEEVGRLPAKAASAAAGILDRVIAAYATSDRAPEARFLGALLQLEPVRLGDIARSRRDLLALATGGMGAGWTSRARYAAAWIDEHDGRADRAEWAYQRLLVDETPGELTDRAKLRLARLRMHDGDFGRAAAWLQEVIESQPSDPSAAADLRELAVRGVLRSRGSAGFQSASAIPIASGLGLPVSAAASVDGSLWVTDAKDGIVSKLDVRGATLARSSIGGARALATDPFGRAFVATRDRLWLVDGTGATAVAEGDLYAESDCLAADATGRVWMAGRKGTRLFRFDPRASTLLAVGPARSERIAALAFDGGRLLAVEDRKGRVFEVMPDGSDRTIAARSVERASALAVDPAGQIAVLDSRAGEIVLLAPSGEARDRLQLPRSILGRPLGLVLWRDGSVLVTDGESGSIVRFR